MELIRISGDKIKISLTKAELDAYDLSVENMDYGHNKTKRAFRELFIEAREQTGFEADGEKVFVQIFRAKNGGCEIFVSKIEKSGLKRTRKPEKRSEIFRFDSANALISVCKALCRLGYSEKSSAYADIDVFYLRLFATNEIQSAFVCELGGVPCELSPLYINEHFSLIRENDAVSLLSEM